MNIKTKIKFKLSELPINLPKPNYVEQTYIDFRDAKINSMIYYLFPYCGFNNLNIMEAIIIKKRKENPIYTLILKSDGKSTREKYEITVCESLANDILSLSNLGTVCKFKYKFHTDYPFLIVEIIKYVKPEALLIAKIQFYSLTKYDSIVDIAKRILGSLIIEDVTFDSKYKNRNLAN